MRGILLVIVLAVVGAAAGTAPATAEEGRAAYRVAAVVYDLSPEYMRSWRDALLRHPAVADGRVRVTVYDGLGSHVSQFDQMTSIVTLGYDAIILIPSDFVSGSLLVHMAAQGGIPVVGSCGPVQSDELLTFIGSDDEEAGYIVSKAVLEKVPAGGNVVILKGPLDMGATTLRDHGMERALAERPDVSILGFYSAGWLKGEAMQAMQRWLISHPDRIHGVIAQNDEMALGAIQAMKTEGMTPLPVAGVDGMPEAVQAVRDGDMLLTLSQDAEAEAQGALDLVLRHLAGNGYQPQAACWTTYPGLRWNDGADRRYDIPWTLIGRE